MHDATRSPFLTYSWLGFRMTTDAAPSTFVNHITSRCHMVGTTVRGSQGVRWISRGKERRWHMSTGAVNFFPRDGDQHAFLLTRESFTDFPVFLIPDAQFRHCLDSDECGVPAELRYHTFRDDAVLRSCLRRLAVPDERMVNDAGLDREQAGRRLILRLVELSGGSRPDWHEDASVFDRRIMAGLVEEIDANLKTTPSISAMALRVGLSPSHFAKKFRQSAGLSLHRFVNLRRVHKALDTLKQPREPLKGVSVELGFSSQSHFTHIFNGLTGMTPAKYQKQFRRTVG